MTSFRKLTTSRLWLYWKRPERGIPLLVFAVLLLHGATIGLTDDEAYYWVLAQTPDWGYAYHPPMVAWVIAASQVLLGWLSGDHAEWLVRLPAVSCASLMLAWAMDWMKEAGAPAERLHRGGGILISFAGLFALAWMMVPDLPLFAAYTAMFLLTWRICFGDSEIRGSGYLLLALTALVSVLSKYSAVLAIFSSGLCVVLWAPRRRWLPAAGALVAGLVLASVPILIWNARHEWASILYQIRDRHEGGGGLSWIRYGRFWAVELLAAGPVLVAFTFLLLRRATRVNRFAAVWVLPAAAVFCLQPLWADFKPHWTFIVWWPAAMVLGWAWAMDLPPVSRAARFQVYYGWALGIVVLLSCHLPLQGFATALFSKPGAVINPRLDVTNDLYGWRDLRGYLKSKLGEAQLIPVVGSHYQTASQAAFALRGGGRATLLPRDIKARDEWPDLGVSDEVGPQWPRLKAPVLYVADNRYDAGPEYPGARCAKLGRLEKSRYGYLAKWIDVWRCEPGEGRP